MSIESIILRVLTLMMLAEGDEPKGPEWHSVRLLYRSFAGEDIAEERLWAEVDSVVADREGAWSMLETVGPYIDAAAKEILVRSAVMVLAADSDAGEGELKLLGRLGAALDLPATRTREIMRQVWKDNKPG